MITITLSEEDANILMILLRSLEEELVLLEGLSDENGKQISLTTGIRVINRVNKQITD